MRTLVVLAALLLASCNAEMLDVEKMKTLEHKQFDSFDEAAEYLNGLSTVRRIEANIKGCMYIVWDGSHGETGFSHMGTCDNEIHKCPCAQQSK